MTLNTAKPAAAGAIPSPLPKATKPASQASSAAATPPAAAGAHPASKPAVGAGNGPTANAPARTAASPATPPAADARIPGTWEVIKPGALVLATEGHAEGWYESLVVATRADDRFLLRWRDWPDEPEFTRRREELALLHPATDPQG